MGYGGSGGDLKQLLAVSSSSLAAGPGAVLCASPSPIQTPSTAAAPTPAPLGGGLQGQAFRQIARHTAVQCSSLKAPHFKKSLQAALQNSSHRFHWGFTHTTVRTDSPKHNKALQAGENHLLPLYHRLKYFTPTAKRKHEEIS